MYIRYIHEYLTSIFGFKISLKFPTKLLWSSFKEIFLLCHILSKYVILCNPSLVTIDRKLRLEEKILKITIFTKPKKCSRQFILSLWDPHSSSLNLTCLFIYLYIKFGSTWIGFAFNN